jgi:hypothetical protein
MRLIEFTRSPRSDKRFFARFMEPERTVYFGTPRQLTYLDHGNDVVRDLHLLHRRLYVNEWNTMDEEIMTSCILWGPTRSIEGNLSRMLQYFKIQDDR